MSIVEQSIGAVAECDEKVEAGRQVWDLPVRIFHWSLAAAFLAAFVTNRLGVAYFKYHLWAGYAVLALVLFRILWWIFGTRHALFRNFVRGPKAIIAYARGLFSAGGPHYAGHNPVGALMVLALLAGAGVQAVLGLFSNDEIINVGPLYGLVTKEQSLALTSLHRKLFYVLAAAIGAHVLAVIAHRIFKGENLVGAMITGRKPRENISEREAISSSRLWLAAALGLAVIAALTLVISHAPAALVDAAEF